MQNINLYFGNENITVENIDNGLLISGPIGANGEHKRQAFINTDPDYLTNAEAAVNTALDNVQAKIDKARQDATDAFAAA